MNVRIGIIQTAKEIDIELDPSVEADELKKTIDKALSGTDALWLTDKTGRQVGARVDKIAYVEIGSPAASNRIGFVG